MKTKLLVPLLLCTCLCSAKQLTDSLLYEGYMNEDLSNWTKYLQTNNFYTLPVKEQKNYLNYEYGYVPFSADRKDPNSQQYLDTFWVHIEYLKPHLTQSEYTAFCCAANAFEYVIDKSKLFSCGLKSFKLAKQAVELDPNNPIALILKGNVYFHAPKAFGGNKQEAMEMFDKAEQLMRNDKRWKWSWNYPAIQLCIAQCLDKLGRKEEAWKKCETTMKEHPHFQFMSKTYMPDLKKRMENDKKNK